ncbi:hypothetical protein K0M31_009757 [Melipona bicolor]|uniref:Uncharacterized protein n=1 Tax=Melipona bicolor TaxID=60889 RepID=A0AA40KIT9_9HYME|nr:hypothetical protein K0M31_009757 [Melipona bicolor]
MYCEMYCVFNNILRNFFLFFFFFFFWLANFRTTGINRSGELGEVHRTRRKRGDGINLQNFDLDVSERNDDPVQLSSSDNLNFGRGHQASVRLSRLSVPLAGSVHSRAKLTSSKT